MNRKIPLRLLAEEISAQAGITEEKAAELVKAFFKLTTDALSEGKTVEIDNLGSFTTTVNAENPVLFMPSRQLADRVNEQFSSFEEIVISDDITEADLEKAASEDPGLAVIEEPIEEVAVDEETVVGQSVEEQPAAEEPAAEEPVAEEPAAEESAAEETAEEIVAEQNVEELPLPVEESQKSETESNVPTLEEENTTEEIEVESADSESGIEPAVESADEPATEPATEPSVEPVTEPSVELTTEPESVEVQTVKEYIPEEEEVLTEYKRPKSRFGIGFLLGFITGLVIVALALAAYLLVFDGSIVSLVDLVK